MEERTAKATAAGGSTRRRRERRRGRAAMQHDAAELHIPPRRYILYGESYPWAVRHANAARTLPPVPPCQGASVDQNVGAALPTAWRQLE